MRESANRLANCDAANARRAASAGARQAVMLAELMETAAWRDLPAQLREVAELRVEYPLPEPHGAGRDRRSAAEQVGAQPPPAPAAAALAGEELSG